MDSSIFFGGSVIAAVVAGSIALFAPCCISVMLPSYFATAFQNKRRLVAMTFLFAAGVATVILPIALGASALQRLFIDEHTLIYVAAGTLLLALGAYVLAGGRIHIPVPGRRAGGKKGPLSVYTLGVFSGVASSCCAPVLAGVIALSGVASSFAMAAGLGAAYVFGMVAPLFVISLLWDRFDFASSRLFRPRSFSWRLGPVRRTISGTALASGLLLLLMGAGTLWIGLTSDAMPASGGWQSDVSSTLQHWGSELTDALAWVPGWLAAAALLAVLLLLGRLALRQLVYGDDLAEEAAADPLAPSAPSARNGDSAQDLETEHDYAREGVT